MSAAAACSASDLTASSLANRRWKDAIVHCCCLDRKAAGVKDVKDRGLVRIAEDGLAVSARTAVRRRRNLAGRVRTRASDGDGAAYMVGEWQWNGVGLRCGSSREHGRLGFFGARR